ncbi:UDP-N-acetylmuramoyl-L-alanyl-D-glutamate--2,6-diaminopimelate ligase [Oceanobacillus bengalensis]|uniref:UDP-N-acetylmuramyl-tripeptide synthetase n=1 Tax=Oceanobacillus bengalensis TaxID=1435466 RepID=A0A494YXN0_9BACI|nr:UDP-N-acetylmuramoyl-L-alanyl-D-glutamate--2,6-diaminopimelate ligase [Oceanobacillus bengalensis]RKQ14883.1 UDP-N-acetylmuramoyl-L-alanyl-D-glutamate--2,6-diaminopimelate ligase [Oceanobacillus bengalensis]
MELTTVLKNVQFEHLKGNLDINIPTIAYDSREIREGSMFVAITGFTVDGHVFIDKAIEKGASVIVLEKDVPIHDNKVTVIKVGNPRNALAKIAANFYNHPTENLNLVGITGTNGKTSTSYLLKSIYEEAQKSIALIGTIGTVINNKVIQNKNTTPESLNLQQFFTEMVEDKIETCMMEVSSHALNLDRVAYSQFNTGIFTNLTPDHLELHKNMEEYFNAKAKLFDMTKQFNIINADDYYGQKLIDMCKNKQAKLITYGIDNQADIYATDIEYSFDRTSFVVNTPSDSLRLTVNLPGDIYVLNSLAAIACAYYNGISLPIIKKGIENVKQISGRFEVIYEKDDFRVVVDFAHTEDALQKTLSTVRPYTKGRIILVFGVYADLSESGTEKRNGMGRVAAEYADFSIVTLDNPKHNNPFTVINETKQAIERNRGNYKAIPDRKEAIEYAVNMSTDKDIIVIAGKGHERTQIIGDTEVPFNEKDIVLHAIERKYVQS